MHVLPASGAADRRSAAEAATVGGAAAAFPWHRDTTRREGQVPVALLDVLLKIYPSTGEAVMAYAPIERREKKKIVDLSTGEISDAPTLWSTLPEEERQEQNEARSSARSRSRLRRFLVHNRLTKMWVLTNRDVLEGPEGYAEMVRRLSGFIRRARRDFFRGRPIPYLWSIEPHPGGHGWHANVMLPTVFIDKRQLQRCWGHGNVWFTDFTTDTKDHFGREIAGAPRSGGSGPARSARRGAKRAAAYVAKYVTKDFGRADIGGARHRYDVAQGFQPPVQRFRMQTFAEAQDRLRKHPSYDSATWSWSSEDVSDWMGWPCRVVWFDPPPSKPRRVKEERRRISSSDPPRTP